MIDIENYKRAIAWLRRGMLELQREPENTSIQLDILHRFEVTHNVTEATLSEAYDALQVDDQSPYISLRAVVSRGIEEGIILPSASQWLKYALLLENTKEAWLTSATVNIDAIVPILPRYADELDAFAVSLNQRMAKLA